MSQATKIGLIITLAFVLGTCVAGGRTPHELPRGHRYMRESRAAGKALQAGELSAYRDAVIRLNQEFPENSRWLRNRAVIEARLGDRAEALRQVRTYASLGLTLDLKEPWLAPLVEISKEVPELKENSEAITEAEKLFSAPDSGLVIEDIAYDVQQKQYFLSSIRQRKILRCDSDGHCRDFVKSSSELPLGAVLALHADSLHSVLWATTAEMNAEADFKKEQDGQSSVLKLDLHSGRLLKRFEPGDGRKHALGDMTVASNGDAYVCDGLSGDVFLISHADDRLKPLAPAGVFVSPQMPVLSADEKLLYVPDYVGGIAALRLSDRHIEWLSSTRPVALEGIDGMYLYKQCLIAIQNGTMPERITAFHLVSPTRIDKFGVLEANWRGLGDPTHGVVIGDQFYFIANSGWDRVADDGQFTEGDAAQIMKRPLGRIASAPVRVH